MPGELVGKFSGPEGLVPKAITILLDPLARSGLEQLTFIAVLDCKNQETVEPRKSASDLVVRLIQVETLPSTGCSRMKFILSVP